MSLLETELDNILKKYPNMKLVPSSKEFDLDNAKWVDTIEDLYRDNYVFEYIYRESLDENMSDKVFKLLISSYVQGVYRQLWAFWTDDKTLKISDDDKKFQMQLLKCAADTLYESDTDQVKEIKDLCKIEKYESFCIIDRENNQFYYVDELPNRERSNAIKACELIDKAISQIFKELVLDGNDETNTEQVQ